MSKAHRIPGISTEGALAIFLGLLPFVLDKMGRGGLRVYIFLFCLSAGFCFDSVVRSEWAESNRSKQIWGGAIVFVLFAALAIWIFGFHVPLQGEKHVAEKSEQPQPPKSSPKPEVSRSRKHPLTDNSHTASAKVRDTHETASSSIDGSEIKRTGELSRVHMIGVDPSLDVLFDAGGPGRSAAVNFINHGWANMYLWGDKLDDGPKSLDDPRTITPSGSYHIWADKVAEEIKSKIGSKGELKVSFHVYVSTEDGRKHILKYLLWATIRDGVFRIETQNLGTSDLDFTLPGNS
jgi:hypothetical protein